MPLPLPDRIPHPPDRIAFRADSTIAHLLPYVTGSNRGWARGCAASGIIHKADAIWLLCHFSGLTVRTVTVTYSDHQYCIFEPEIP